MAAFNSHPIQRRINSLQPTFIVGNPSNFPLDEFVDPPTLSSFESVFRPIPPPGSGYGLSVRPYIRHITSSFRRLGAMFDTICPDNYKTRRGSWHLASAVALQSHISTQRHFSLETASAYLRTQNLLQISGDATNHLHHYYAFCLIGISAHLFRPSDKGPVQNMYIIEDCVSVSTHRSWSILSNKVLVRDPRLPITRLIRGFGDLSPVIDGDQRSYRAKTVSLRAERFNAHLFCSVLKMNIVWTDILSLHLDYDTETNTIFLFRHATFCSVNSTFAKSEKNAKIWESCIELEGPADYDHPKDLMCEIMLSLYMIFGQEIRAQQYFRPKKAFEGWPQADHDHLLAMLCGGDWPFQASTYEPKPIYYLSRDFPMMQAKLDLLNDVVMHKEPKSLLQLWRDKRNTGQWYTFWAVIFYGSLGLMVALAQLATSVVALYK